eukprot:gene13473-28545_t
MHIKFSIQTLSVIYLAISFCCKLEIFALSSHVRLAACGFRLLPQARISTSIFGSLDMSSQVERTTSGGRGRGRGRGGSNSRLRMSTTSSSSGNLKICFDFQKGNCQRGDSCKFSHIMTASPNAQKDMTPREVTETKRPRESSISSIQDATANIPPPPRSRIVDSTSSASNLLRKKIKAFSTDSPNPPKTIFQDDTNPSNRDVTQAMKRLPIQRNPKPATSASSMSMDISDSTDEIEMKIHPKSKTAHPTPFPLNTHSTSTSASSSTPAPKAENVYSSSELFSNLSIAIETRRAIAEVMKYTHMTPVQAATLPVILQGDDCLAKAKTGTGKTLAFLIPAIEILRTKASKTPHGTIPILILSPTRELAAQIAAEAMVLLSFQQHIKVVCVVGGTNINTDKKSLSGQVSILVATPGRLIDHLQNTPDFSNKFRNMNMLIMDEADQLLEMGFRPDIERILKMLPPSSLRQTLLFSATISSSVQQIASVALRPGYGYLDTVGEESEQTHLHVKQEIVVVPLEKIILSLVAILIEKMKEPNYKIIVFFTTARATGYMAELVSCLGKEILEIHSRKSQSQRTRTSERFRDGTNMVMFSSDVSARGMDYPDVTFVLQ